MKKIIYTLIIGMVIICLPNKVLAENTTYSTLVDNILNGEWQVDPDETYYDIVITTGLTDAEYKETKAREITIYYCDKNNLGETKECTLDDAVDNDDYITFDLEGSKNVYTLSGYTTQSTYDNFKAVNKVYFYSIEDDNFTQLQGGSLKLVKINVKEDESMNKSGTLNNPYIITNGTGSIDVPAEEDELWDTTNGKLYFKVEMPDDISGSWGRYTVDKNSFASFIYAYNNEYSDVNNDTIMPDADNDTYWLFRPSMTFYLYAPSAKAYGSKLTITFVDNKIITLYTDVGVTEAENTYGSDLDFTDSNSYDAVYGCAILGDHVTEWVKWLITIIRVIVPIGIVILTILDFAKIVASGEDKEYKAAIQKLVKRIVIAVAIFVVPALVALLIDLSGILTQYGITDDLFCSLF